MMLLLLFMIFSLFELQAEQASSLHKLMRAKSAEDLMVAQTQLQTLASYRQACYWELESEQAPVHCFYVQHYAGKVVHRHRTLSSSDLDQLCIEFANELSDLETVKQKAKIDYLSKPCQKVIARQIQILTYQQQASSAFL